MKCSRASTLLLVIVTGALVAGILREASAERGGGGGRHRDRDRDRDRDRGRVRIRKKPKGRECERIKEPLCTGAGLPYNRTRLPNLLGHARQKLAGRALQDYRPLIESGCSPYIRVFLCASFLPECPRKKRNDPLQPCRSLCEKARVDCEPTLNAHGRAWPDELGCDSLPQAKPNEKREKCINYEPPRPDYCNLHKDVGPCRTYYPFWYFDSSAKECKPFTYGGCLGNNNRFPSKEGCLRTCGLGSGGAGDGDTDVEATTASVTVSTTTAPSTAAPTTAEPVSPPVIDGSPQGSMIAEGQGVTLECHAEGALEYTWSRQDSEMPENKIVSEMVMEGKAILVLHNLTWQDSGYYTCTAENDAGVDEATAKITVMAVPRITRLSPNVTLTRGQPFELVCQATGSPQPRVTWERKDGKRVLMRRNGTLAILAVESASTSDSGVYFCKAANSLGSAVDIVHVKVLVPLTLYKPPLRNTTGNVGDVVTWSCAATGYPQPNIYWERVGGDLPEDRISLDGMMETSMDGTNDVMSKLTLSDLQPNDTSEYRCVTQSSIGNVSSLFSLAVNVPPRWDEKPIPQVVNEGEDATLACKARGSTPMNVTWRVEKLKNYSVPSEELPRYTVDNVTHSLTVAGVVPADREVTFHCDVANEAGAITANAKLNVIEQWQLPKITSALPNVTAFVGEDVSMRCDVTGEPVPLVTWFLASIGVETLGDERFSVGEGGASLLVRNVNLRDAGSYTCLAGNDNGVATETGRLEVVEPSLTLTQGLSNTTVANGSALSLLCAASGRPEPEVLWFFNDRPVNASASPGYLVDGGNLTVRAVAPAYEGKYGCLVNNQFFVRSSVAMVNISRPPTRPSTDNEVDVPDLNRTFPPNEVAVPPSAVPDMQNTSCAPCQEPQEVPTCDDQPQVKPRRYDITDAGMKGYYRGWVDVTGQGAANDYCRIIMTPTRGLDSSMQLVCALAGTAGESEYNYASGEHFDIGQMDTWYMRDEDGDGRDDYCRCVSEGPDGQYVYCTKAEESGFHGAPGIGDTQYSFKARGDRRQLRKCRKRKVDPFFGLSGQPDN